MPRRRVSFTDKQDAYVQKMLASGEYRNASEVIRDALRALQHRRREDALKLKALRARIDEGLAALERGDFIELNDVELQDYLRNLCTESDRGDP